MLVVFLAAYLLQLGQKLVTKGSRELVLEDLLPSSFKNHEALDSFCFNLLLASHG